MKAKQRKILLLSAALYAFWIICMFSSQTAAVSSGESVSLIGSGIRFLERLGFINPQNPEYQNIVEKIYALHGVLRTFAHFFVFMVLGFFYDAAVCEYEEKSTSAIGKSLVLGLFAAGVDEIHQYFVPGRSAQIIDVLVDFSGVLLGVTAFCLLCLKLKLRDYIGPK